MQGLVCPYYAGHKGTDLSCEYLIPGQPIVSSFQSEQALEQSMRELCMGDYKNCPLYRWTTGFLDRLRQANREEAEPRAKEVGRGSAVIWIE